MIVFPFLYIAADDSLNLFSKISIKIKYKKEEENSSKFYESLLFHYLCYRKFKNQIFIEFRTLIISNMLETKFAKIVLNIVNFEYWKFVPSHY